MAVVFSRWPCDREQRQPGRRGDLAGVRFEPAPGGPSPAVRRWRPAGSSRSPGLRRPRGGVRAVLSTHHRPSDRPASTRPRTLRRDSVGQLRGTGTSLSVRSVIRPARGLHQTQGTSGSPPSPEPFMAGHRADLHPGQQNPDHGPHHNPDRTGQPGAHALAQHLRGHTPAQPSAAQRAPASCGMPPRRATRHSPGRVSPCAAGHVTADVRPFRRHRA